MRTLFIAAALLSLALVPAASAEAGNPVKDTVDCLTGSYLPETSIYQIAWHCTLGGVYPEPIEQVTGCKPSSPPDLSGCFSYLRWPDPNNPCDWFGTIYC